MSLKIFQHYLPIPTTVLWETKYDFSGIKRLKKEIDIYNVIRCMAAAIRHLKIKLTTNRKKKSYNETIQLSSLLFLNKL